MILKSNFMRHSKRYMLHLLSLVLFFTVGCNSPDQTNKSEIVDSSANNKKETINKTYFDTSLSVTTISPVLYKALADTLNIRILEGTYKPGDSSIMHGHPDFALYVLEGSTVELTSAEGNKQNIDFKKGMAVILPATTHSAKNIGKSTLRLVVVEVNRPRD
ncbi:MAG: cupin domain-containing protein [Saprospiraceae bacterium]|nr:cupin domain-containing protein [Saprospiraceae bacterium]